MSTQRFSTCGRWQTRVYSAQRGEGPFNSSPTTTREGYGSPTLPLLDGHLKLNDVSRHCYYLMSGTRTDERYEYCFGLVFLYHGPATAIESAPASVDFKASGLGLYCTTTLGEFGDTSREKRKSFSSVPADPAPAPGDPSAAG